MAELTTQEQQDLTKINTLTSFNHKFTDQLNQMSALSSGKLERLNSTITELKKLDGVIWKSNHQDQFFSGSNPTADPIVDENGDAVLDENGYETYGDTREMTDAEITALVDQAYTDEITKYQNKADKIAEDIRLIEVELDFRRTGKVERDPIGTTYYHSFTGNDSVPSAPTGTSNSNTIRYWKNYVNNTRAPGDVLICRRPRGGVNPSLLQYKINDGTADRGGSAQSSKSAVPDEITADGKTIKMPTYVTGPDHRYNSDNSRTTVTPDNGFIDTREGHGISCPRDRSTVGMLYNRYFSSSDGSSEAINPTSDGTVDDPIIMMADYENEWGDFIDCRVGANGDDLLNHTTTANKGGYVVKFGSKIIRRTFDGTSNGQKIPVHSYITPYDWIFVGQLDSNGKPEVGPGTSDDPYEYAYMVRDVNYDKIVLWHNYKGEMSGERRGLVSMGYAPMWKPFANKGGHSDQYNGSGNGQYSATFNDDFHWVFQGIMWSAGNKQSPGNSNSSNHRRMLDATGNTCISFKDCYWMGASAHSSSYPYYNRIDIGVLINGANNDLKFYKCGFLNIGTGIHEYYQANKVDYQQVNTIHVEDTIFNGSIVDRIHASYSGYNGYMNDHNASSRGYNKPHHKTPCSGIWANNGASKWVINDCEFYNHEVVHIWMARPDQTKMRNLRFYGHGMDFIDPTVNTIYEAHENLGLRWARPAFARHVADYKSDTASTSDPTQHMNSTSNNPTFTSGNNDSCRRLLLSTGDWQSTDKNKRGVKWYNYVQYAIADAQGGWEGLDETGLDFETLHLTNWQGSETDANGNARSAYRRCGGYTTGQYNNWATGHNRNNYFNRKANATAGTEERYCFTNYFGTLALVGGLDIGVGANSGKIKFEVGTEKWNNWWNGSNSALSRYTGTTSSDNPDGASQHVPWGQPYADELYHWYNWFPTHYNQGDPYNVAGGGYNESNTHFLNDSRTVWGYGNSYPYQTNAPCTNISIHDTSFTQNTNTDYGAEAGNGPGCGIGFSPSMGPVWSYYPAYGHYYNTAYSNTYATNSGTGSDNFAVQDYFHLYLNYDKELGDRSDELVPEGLHPPMKGSRIGDSSGISKNVIFNQRNKWHKSWRTSPHQAWFSKGYGKDEPPLMETMGQAIDAAGDYNSILRAGGGSYVIQVNPPQFGIGHLKEPDTAKDLAKDGTAKYYGRWYERGKILILEYPFYLSTNARTYTVYLHRGLRTATKYVWGADPTPDELFLEMDYIASKSSDNLYLKPDVRRRDRSNTAVPFQSGTEGWKALSLTVTPETEGVGYLRLWYCKQRESNKANVFYVDPKVEVT